jgi:hypothetical protein
MMPKYPKLTDDEVKTLNRDRCADCSSLLVDGPSGGGSQNYYCSQSRCGSKFNVSLSWERISAPSPNERKT